MERPVDLGITGAIDPGHVVGEDGKRYLFLNGVRRVRLSATTAWPTDGPVEHVYDGWRYPDDWVTEAYALEGPKLFRRGEWFYLVSAVGGTAGPPTSHMVTVARSRSVHGPWENDAREPGRRARAARTRRGGRAVTRRRWRGPTATGGSSTTATRTASARSAARCCSNRSSGRMTAGSGRRAATCRRPIRKPAASGRGPPPGMPLSDRLAGPALGPQWAFYAPAPRARRAASGSTAARCAWPGRERTRSDASPLTVPAGDRAYEVEVTRRRRRGRRARRAAAVLQPRAVPRHGLGRRHHDHVQRRSPQPLRGAGRRPRDALHLRIGNDHHIVTFFHSADGDGLDPARRALRDQRLQRQHGERPAQPAPGAVRRRPRRGRRSATSATAPWAKASQIKDETAPAAAGDSRSSSSRWSDVPRG